MSPLKRPFEGEIVDLVDARVLESSALDTGSTLVARELLADADVRVDDEADVVLDAGNGLRERAASGRPRSSARTEPFSTVR